LVEDGFVTTSNSLKLDGRKLRLKPIDTGAYTIVSESGSFYDAIVGWARARSAARSERTWCSFVPCPGAIT
jgi:hypothetical protein